MRKLLPCTLTTLLLTCTGCAMDPVTTTLAGGATLVSYSVVGKSAVDYGLSEYRQQDCDIRNPKKYNGRYCVDIEETKEVTLEQEEVYCYRSLGDVYCTRKEDPGRDSPLEQTTTAHRSDYGTPLPATKLRQSSSNRLRNSHEPAPGSPSHDARLPRAASNNSSAGRQKSAEEELRESYRSQPTSILPRPASDPVLHGS